MLTSNRGALAAFGRACLALALCLLLSAAPAHAQRSSNNNARATQQNASQDDAARQAPYSTDYQQRCEHPQSHDDADLCQQWRAANAAEENARWAVVQAVGLLVTLALSALATILSLRALWIAERDLTERDKPVLRVEPGKIDWLNDMIVVDFSIENIGQKSATIDGILLGITTGRWAPEPKSILRNMRKHWAHVPNPTGVLDVGEIKKTLAQATPSFTAEEWQAIRDPERAAVCFLYGYITYRDEMQNTRRRNVCICFSRPSKYLPKGLLAVYRGDQYDSDKRIRAPRPIWFGRLRIWLWERQAAKRRQKGNAAQATPPAK